MQEPDEETNRLSHEVIGAALEVHKLLGPGFLEEVYEQALSVELELRGIPHLWQAPVAVQYKSHPVGEGRLDILVGSRLIVELKAVENLLPIHSAQLLSYLKATGLSLGLLINFNVSVLRSGIKRIVLS
jgi:GxxExxY protein